MKNSFKNFYLIDHPLIKREMTTLRNKRTTPDLFRSAVKRISNILGIYIFQDLPVKQIRIDTPLEKTKGHVVNRNIVLVPVLRAGLGMVSGFLDIIPEAKLGHIGLERNEETLKPSAYYNKTPRNLGKSKVIVIDPMLATGGSASAALSFLKKKGAKDLIFACLVSAPEGIKKLQRDHPEIKIYSAALDRCLNNKGYILPGLGDAGDRTFGTL